MGILDVYIKLSKKSIFLNVFRHWNGLYIPIQFQIFSFSSQPNMEEEDSKEEELEKVRLFADALVIWLTGRASSIEFLFSTSKSLGAWGSSSRTALRWRRIIVEAIIESKMPVSAFIDRSKIAFNGCKTKKMRRKKLNPATEEELKKKAARRKARRLERNKKD